MAESRAQKRARRLNLSVRAVSASSLLRPRSDGTTGGSPTSTAAAAEKQLPATASVAELLATGLWRDCPLPVSPRSPDDVPVSILQRAPWGSPRGYSGQGLRQQQQQPRTWADIADAAVELETDVDGGDSSAASVDTGRRSSERSGQAPQLKTVARPTTGGTLLDDEAVWSKQVSGLQAK